MQGGIGESFWDAHGVEIGACAVFEKMALFMILFFFKILEGLGRDSKQNQIHQPARLNMWIFENIKCGVLRKKRFLEHRGKGRNFASGVRFSESARSIFSPRGTE